MTQQQRTTKLEAEELRRVLKAAWVKAYNEGELILSYPESPVGAKEAKNIHSALGSYRRYIRERKGDNFQSMLICSAVILRKNGDYIVELVRKKNKFSSRAETVMALSELLPELQAKNELDMIMDDFNLK